jgi:hypothetical protein
MISESQKRAIKKWRENNREKYIEYVKNWKASHPEYKEKNNEYVKKSRAKKAAAAAAVTCTIESCP